jgi:serine/threonine protein kinase
MPPEIINRQPYDKKVDIWSMGCLIFEMLAGKMPFSGLSRDEAFSNICSAALEIPADIQFSVGIVRLLSQVFNIFISGFRRIVVLFFSSNIFLNCVPDVREGSDKTVIS